MLDVEHLIVDPALDLGGRVRCEAPVSSEVRPVPSRLRLEVLDDVLAAEDLGGALLPGLPSPDVLGAIGVGRVQVVLLPAEVVREPGVVLPVDGDDDGPRGRPEGGGGMLAADKVLIDKVRLVGGVEADPDLGVNPASAVLKFLGGELGALGPELGWQEPGGADRGLKVLPARLADVLGLLNPAMCESLLRFYLMGIGVEAAEDEEGARVGVQHHVVGDPIVPLKAEPLDLVPEDLMHGLLDRLLVLTSAQAADRGRSTEDEEGPGDAPALGRAATAVRYLVRGWLKQELELLGELDPGVAHSPADSTNSTPMPKLMGPPSSPVTSRARRFG